jgi:hypothetical protein
MRKLFLALGLVLVVTLVGCSGNNQTETKLRVTQHESGEVTVCLFEIYEDGTQESTCDLFMLDTSDLEQRITDLEDQAE